MSKPEFEEIAELKDDSGVVAVITRYVRANGYPSYSWSLFKEFSKRDGSMQRTTWKNQRHIAPVISLLHRVDERIALEIEKDFKSKR